jgi:hypothetical protein
VEEIPVELRAMARRGVKPTSEQMAVVDAAKAPGDVPLRGEIVRVTAAAGTGKTTTMELVAKRLLDIGHAGVVYMVFNKAAQLEAQRRLPGGVRCRTLDAVALSLVGANGMPLKGDDDAQRYVLSVFGRDIDRFLRDVPREHMTFNLRNYIAMCIWKTLVRFMQSKDDEASGFDPAESARKTWYPAVKYHLGTLVRKEKKKARARRSRKGKHVIGAQVLLLHGVSALAVDARRFNNGEVRVRFLDVRRRGEASAGGLRHRPARVGDSGGRSAGPFRVPAELDRNAGRER